MKRVPPETLTDAVALRAYADLYERAPVGYLTLDRGGRVLELNKTAFEMLGGVTREAILGWPFELYVAPGHRRHFVHHLYETIRAQGTRSCHVPLAAPRSGPLFIAYLESAALVDEAGRRVIRTVMSDATERFREENAFQEVLSAERARREEAAAVRQRIDKIAAASAELAESLDLDAATSRAAQIGALHVSWYCAVDLQRDDGAVVRAAFARRDGAPRDLPLDPYAPHGSAAVVREGRPQIFAELVHAQLFGLASGPGDVRELHQRVGSYLCVPLRAHGRTIGAMTFVQPRGVVLSSDDVALAGDVARHAALAIDNARLYREAQESDRRKDEFLAMLGHELRNPLAAVVTAAKTMLLRDDGSAPGSQRIAEVVARQGDRLVRIVDDLLDVSRITRGKIALQRRRVVLCQVIDKAVESTRPLVEAKGHVLTVSLSDRPTVLDADPDRLEQVMVNLLANAAKYTPPGGRIEVEAGDAGDDTVVRVRDTGVGIPRDKLQVVFAPFTQLETTPDRTNRGLGIGLALASTLVELHGGRITAHSDGPGRGSEFVVRLPRALDAPRVEEAAPPPPPASRRRVLVVEDNPDVAMMLQEELELLGQEVRTADDGREAIAAALDFRPELLLIDIGLPGMTGYDVAGRLRQERALDGAKLVALTGYGGPETTKECLEAGFDRHFTKPITEAALMGLLRAP